MAVQLATFLSNNVEGYLFTDIATLEDAAPPKGKVDGAAGYPLLMTVFAGIELLGNLVSSCPFDRNDGAQRFDEYWRQYLYAGHTSRLTAGAVLYKLARHGLAHAFVVKGEVEVYKNAPDHHLTRSAGGAVSVDAVQLSTDLRSSYDSKVKPNAVQGGSLFNVMSTRLAEMETEYSRQAVACMSDLTLPQYSVATGSMTTGSSTATGPAFPMVYKSNP